MPQGFQHKLSHQIFQSIPDRHLKKRNLYQTDIFYKTMVFGRTKGFTKPIVNVKYCLHISM